MLVHNNIRRIGNFEHIMPFINHDNADKLVIFDIDDTILRVACYKASGTWYKDAYDQLTAQGKSAEETKFILFQTHIAAMYSTAVELTDANLPGYITALRKKNTRTICLTAREGRCLLYATLRHLGDTQLDFTQVDPHLSRTLSFPELPDHDIIYSSGILFTGGADKGEVLKLFFKKTGYIPKHIVFIDDSLPNVESVKTCAQELGIPFDGFHFRAAEKTARQQDLPLAPPIQNNRLPQLDQ